MSIPAGELDVETSPFATRAFVRSVLEHPNDRPWVMQEIGLMALRLGDDREWRLHLWDPGGGAGDGPIHDHPFDFTSTVISGEITNTRFEETSSGVEYQRDRYSPTDEQHRLTDTVRLSSTSQRVMTGESYRQSARELHQSTQTRGAITVLRRTFLPVETLTVCRPLGDPWISGRSRPATADEVRRITTTALESWDGAT